MSMPPPPPQAPAPAKLSKTSQKGAGSVLNYLHNHVMNINNSKLFAGLMIIVLNIASRFVTIKLSKTMESYLKYTFSRDILVFAISWMGTRDIYVAAGLTLAFIFVFDFLFNENSSLCILPNEFKEYYHNMDEDISHDDYVKAQTTVEKYVEQKETKKCNCPK
jgi:hypothetical protein